MPHRPGKSPAPRLEDSSWRTGVVLVHGKGGHRDQVPLPVDVGGLLAAYLQGARSAGLAHRQVFVALDASHDRLGACAVSSVVARAASRGDCGLRPIRPGGPGRTGPAMACGSSVMLAGAVMTNETTRARVRDFFATVGDAGLILPSGWFGRPYDNLLQLTRSEVTDGTLVLELDGHLTLTFSGEPEATSSENGLRLSGFSALAWDWTEFGSTESHHEEFVAGKVEFVAAMG